MSTETIKRIINNLDIKKSSSCAIPTSFFEKAYFIKGPLVQECDM